jgi:hypothetical protein
LKTQTFRWVIINTLFAFPLAGCVAVGAVNYAGVAYDDSQVGKRSIPRDSGIWALTEGHFIYGVVDVSPDLSVFLVTFNSEPWRRTFQKGPFVIGLQLNNNPHKDQTEYSFDPNSIVLKFENKTIRPLGYAIKYTSCHPAREAELASEYDNPLSNNNFKTHWWHTSCIDLYFDVVPPSPESQFAIEIPPILEGKKLYNPITIQFVSHYGL